MRKGEQVGQGQLSRVQDTNFHAWFIMSNRCRILNWLRKRQIQITWEASVITIISTTSEIRRGNL